MAIINNITEVLHKIRVKLYPNYLHNVEGAYIARTDSEASLTIEQVCAALKNRGGFGGDYEDLVEGVKQFFDEAAYQLCDGFAVNTGYYSIHPNVGGTFNNTSEIHDHKKHPITFRFRTGSKLRRLVEHIAVDIEGIADTGGWIDEFIDVESDTINDSITPNGQFVLHGHKIKAAGDHSGVGVYFENTQGDIQRVKVTGRLAENTSSKIIGIVPALPSPGAYRVVIVTQFSSGSSLLKEPRTITSGFTVSVE